MTSFRSIRSPRGHITSPIESLLDGRTPHRPQIIEASYAGAVTLIRLREVPLGRWAAERHTFLRSIIVEGYICYCVTFALLYSYPTYHRRSL